MNIDTGLAVIIVAVLIFYLRMIVIQRERVKRLRRAAQSAASKEKKKGKSAATNSPPPTEAASFSMVSKKISDRIIGAVGFVLIVVGVLFYTRIIPLPIFQEYWWIPTALGIVLFSWMFKL